MKNNDHSMTDVSLFRLYLLRASYLLLVLGLGSTMWPLIINHSFTWPLMNSVVAGLLGAVAVLAAIGIRYPLQMLPLLLFELVWKLIWLVSVALPLWSAGRLDANTLDTVRDCLIGVVLMAIVIPWPYMVSNYVKRRGDRWKRANAQ